MPTLYEIAEKDRRANLERLRAQPSNLPVRPAIPESVNKGINPSAPMIPRDPEIQKAEWAKAQEIAASDKNPADSPPGLLRSAIDRIKNTNFKDIADSIESPFKIDQKSFARPGEGVVDYAGRRVKEAFTDTTNDLVQKFTGSSSQDTSVRPPPTKLIAVNLPPVRDLKGGFVGADTDSEAARNIRSRLEQDAAAGQVAASTDRAIERLRDLRASRLGISRNALDQYEGRAEKPQEAQQVNPFAMPGDSFGDAELRERNLMNIIIGQKTTPRRREAATKIYDSYMDRAQPAKTASTSQSYNPADMNKFLLDNQKFLYQQQADKSRFELDQQEAAINAADKKLNQRRYDDERRSKFMENFSYPDPDAPSAQIGAMVWQASEATGGVVPPEILVSNIQKLAEKEKVDWKDAPPADLSLLVQQALAMEVAKAGGK